MDCNKIIKFILVAIILLGLSLSPFANTKKADAASYANDRIVIDPTVVYEGGSVRVTVNNPRNWSCEITITAPGSTTPVIGPFIPPGSYQCVAIRDVQYNTRGTYNLRLEIRFGSDRYYDYDITERIGVFENPPSVSPPSVAFFTSNRTQVNQYQNITLGFRCQNSPQGARIDNNEQNFHFTSPPPVGRMPNAGSVDTAPTVTNQAGTTYTLTCLGDGNRTATRNITVVVMPTGTPNFTFSTNDGRTLVDFNTPVTLQWRVVSDITSCAASNNRSTFYSNWGGIVPVSGSRRILPNIMLSVTFTLTCYNGTGAGRIQASKQVVINISQNGYLVFGGNNKIQAAIFLEGAMSVNGGNDSFTGSFVARSFNDLSNLVNVRFFYDYNLSRNWPPGFRYLNMPQPTAH